MFKCVYDPCDEVAEYIYMGKSLCEFHFKKEAKEAMGVVERAEERINQRSK